MARTKSPIGNNAWGFTFVEVMVSLVVLTAGIVLIYRSFFLCVDYLNRLTCRLYASHLIDAKIADISRSFAEGTGKEIDFGDPETAMDINHQSIHFRYDIALTPLKDVSNVWQLDVQLAWVLGQKPMHLVRYAYISR